jgi:hypothetical protein
MADFTTDTRQIKSLLASTLEKMVNEGVVADAIYQKRWLLNRLMNSEAMMSVDGGERLRGTFQYIANTTAGSYADDEPLDVTLQDNETSWFVNWKQYSASIVITGKEMMLNKGSQTRLFNLLGQRTKDASQSVQNKIVQGIFSDGTGNGSKDITGFLASMETTPGTTSYAGVPTSNTAWRNKSITDAGSAAVNLLTHMRSGYNQVLEVGGEGPNSSINLWVTTRAVHESYEALHVPAQRYSPSETPDFGLEKAPLFKGEPVIWDPQCTSGTMFGLDMSCCGLAVHEDRNFSESEEGLQKPANQDTLISQIFFLGNHFTSNRARLLKISGIT